LVWKISIHWCKHVHGIMKMCFMKHTSCNFNITSKNTTFTPTWHFLFNVLIFFIPIYFSIKFFVWPFYFYNNTLKRKCHVGINVVFLEVILKLWCMFHLIFVYLTNTWNSLGKKVCHTKCVTLLAFLTIYFDGIFFWKEIF
jgi:hypothetical protein